MIDVLLDVPAATGFAFAGGALFLLLGAPAPMQMLLSLLVALCCPRLLIAIAKVAVAAAAHLLLAMLLWLPSCSAGTVSGDRPFAEELPPSSASLPPLPPLPSLMCVSMLAAAAVAAIATTVAVSSLISTHRHRRRSRCLIAVSPSNRSPDLGLTSASGLASSELRASRSSESVVEASESVVEAVVEAVPTAPAVPTAQAKVLPMSTCHCCSCSSDTLLPPPSPPPMVSEPEDVAEAEALAALRALPTVKAVKVLPAGYGRLAGYTVDLWCRSRHVGAAKGEQLRRSQKRLSGAAVCQDLLQLVTAKHSGQDCLVAAEAACATAAAAAAAAEPTPTTTPTAFAAMQAAARVPALAAAVEAAFANADAAASELEAAQAEALRLEEEAELVREAAQLPRKRQKEAAPEEGGYGAYSLRKFHELEKKEQDRRGVPVDRTQMDLGELPRGDEQRGWRTHWRRGMHGALRSWAKGKLGAIVFMLAALTVDFGVVDEVCPPRKASPPLSSSPTPLMWQVAGELNLKLSSEQVEDAKTDAYIIGRIKSVLYVLKQCDSEAARVAYGTILAAVAPPRLEERSGAGMIRKIAGRLNVQRGTRSYKSAWYNGRFTRESEPRPFDQVCLLAISCNLPACFAISCNLPAQPGCHAVPICYVICSGHRPPSRPGPCRLCDWQVRGRRGGHRQLVEAAVHRGRDRLRARHLHARVREPGRQARAVVHFHRL